MRQEWRIAFSRQAMVARSWALRYRQTQSDRGFL